MASSPPEHPAPAARAACRHCGTPFRPTEREGEFCCTGCRHVYRLIQEGGFDRYYDLKHRTTAPVQSAPFVERDWAWLRERAGVAEERAAAAGGAVELSADLQGISCLGCVWLIEKLFDRRPGSLHLEVNAQLGSLRMRYRGGEFDPVAFAHELQQFGYTLGPPGEKRISESSRLVARVGLCGAFALNAMLFTLPRYLGMEEDFAFAGLFQTLAALFATLSLAVGGSYFITRAWEGLRAGVLHIDLPIALGVVGAYVGSLAGWFLRAEPLIYFDFVSLFLFLMLTGRWVQEAAVEKNRHRLLSARAEPKSVEAVTGGAVRTVPVDEIAEGMRLRVRGGVALPVCARVPEGSSLEASLESINGESEPRLFRPGQLVPAGALPLSREPVELVATQRWEDSLLRRLLTAEADGPRRNRLLERILRAYITVVLALSAGGWLFWGLVLGDGLTGARAALSLLVVSCPCALGVALPLASERATALARRLAVYVRAGDLWERLSRVREVVFDKTGTLTLEAPVLQNPEALRELDAEARAALQDLARATLHPIGRALREELAGADDPRTDRVHEQAPGALREVVGAGMVLEKGGVSWSLGRPDWDPAAGQGSTGQTRLSDCVLRREGTVVAAFHFADAARPQAAEVLAHLRRSGYGLHILSGDRAAKVTALARELGLPEGCARGELSPEEKAAAVRALETSGEALMVGDGLNDSLAFEAASCRATPVVDMGALEQRADFYFLGRGLGAVSGTLTLARAHRRGVRAVFAFAVAYNAGAGAVCLMGLMNPLLAAILMPLSSLVTLALAAAIVRLPGR